MKKKKKKIKEKTKDEFNMIESCITFLSVSDLKRTVQFYTEVIGLTLWKDMGN